MKSISFPQGIDRIIREFKLAEDHGKRALMEAELLPGDIPPEEVKRRVDLRGEVIVTIDGEKARDFDDAVSVQRKANGHYLLKVSIADVSHFVTPGSALDRTAYQLGTSTYFPDRCLPMLPERLSNDLCSLVPHQDRLTFTAEIELDPTGRVVARRFYRSIIRSAARLTYTLVRKMLVDHDPDSLRQFADLVPHLKMLAELAELLRQQRMLRGSLDFDLPEPEIILDMEAGGVEGIIKAERNLAHRMIEDLMIAANEAVATFVTESKMPMMYRVHPRPEPGKLRDFAVVLSNLGLSIKLGKLGKNLDPQLFSKIIQMIQGRPEEKFIQKLLLRTMSQAVYSTHNVGHFGLASRCYTHFTSPIRRYPDLVVHRALAAALDRRPSQQGMQGQFEEMAVHCSERERNAMKAEWASRDLAAAFFMKDKVGEEFAGIIAGVAKFGLFVELTPYFVEGMLPLRNLKDDYYVFHEKSHEIVGRKTKKKYRLGDPMAVTVVGVNLERRWVDLRP